MSANGATSNLGAIFASNLRSARRAAGLTQHELAVALGRGDAMTVSRWERAENRPNDENLVALCEVLHREPSWFYAEHKSSSGRAAA